MSPLLATLVGAPRALGAFLLGRLARRTAPAGTRERPATPTVVDRVAPDETTGLAREARDEREECAARDRVDREAFRALRASGADLARPTDVMFFLRFPSLHAAESAAAQVAALPIDGSRLGVRLERGPLGAGWLCLVTAHAAPSEGVIRSACGSLRGVALEYGGDLDGWGLAVES